MSIESIKKKSLEEHIPIIMDDTLEVIKEILIKEKPARILEIGTATGYSSICFATILLENWYRRGFLVYINRYNRTRRRKSK